MKAAVRDRYGSPDVVRVDDIERPVPEADQVLVRVRAASVNRADLDGIEPRPQFTRLFLGLRAPRNRRVGIDVAGVVEAVGADVTRFRPGDEVFADLFAHGQGSFAEYVAAADRAFLPIGSGLTFDQAATLPHSAILAIQALRLRNGRTPRPGDRVLIDGAGGNVGPFAIQIAKALGAEVTAVDGADKADLMRSLGADHVLDYRSMDYTATGQRYDWILATDAHHSIRRVRRALRPRGVYIILGGTASAIAQALVLGPLLSIGSDRHMGLMLWWKPFHADDVARLIKMAADGTLTPVIDRRYTLGEVVEALRWVDDGHARGKVVITF